MRVVAAVFALAFASIGLAAPPPAPTLTVAATDIRQLEFNWDPVSGAQSYELWFRSAPGAQWAKFREQPAQKAPLFRIGVSVHLLDWRAARYYVAACNTGGCTPSNQVSVESEALSAIGFIKPKAPTGHTAFGNSVAASADGKTIAVLTAETIGTKNDSAAIHVYRKTTSSSGWRREARLVPSTIQAATGYILGDPLALSADGNLLIFGNPGESTAQEDGPRETGAVYVFRRTDSTWSQAQKIASSSRYTDAFGYEVKIDDAGRTLIVSHSWPEQDSAPGTLEVYRDAANDGIAQFVHTRTIDTPTVDENCRAIALSGDGTTLLRSCVPNGALDGYTQVLKAPNFAEISRLPFGSGDGVETSFDGKTVAIQFLDFVEVYELGPLGWGNGQRLHWIEGVNNYSRRRIALSRDGKILAIGNWMEWSVGVGPVYPPYQPGTELQGNGGVVIWERKPSSLWTLRRLVKPGSYNDGWAGHAVALGDNGKLLVVGAPRDPSAATGIDGDRDDDSAWERGAVWLY